MLRNTVKSGLYDILLFILQFKSQAIRYLLPNISFIKPATERLVFSNASVELLYRAYNSPLFSLLSFLFNSSSTTSSIAFSLSGDDIIIWVFFAKLSKLFSFTSLFLGFNILGVTALVAKTPSSLPGLFF